MRQHIISFNAIEARLLAEQYQLLFRHFEEGNGPRAQYLATLKATMQQILFSQDGLKDFWLAVKDNPQQQYHLHLVYKVKELLNLPWQLAVDGNVCISKNTSPVKRQGSLLPHPGPLKLLVMISSPEDLDIHHRLSYEKEEDVLLKALGPLLETGQVQIDFTEDGSLETLERRLASKLYQVLYFSGHGAYRNDTGYLLLEQKNTLNSQQVTAQRLGRALLQAKEHTPSLVILASCQTAQGSSRHGFRGVADELTRIGIPAVIAMAASVQDHYATLFAGELFNGLAKKEKLPVAYGNALERMRQDEQGRFDRSGRPGSPVQWLIPQLYCNQQVDDLVDWQQMDTRSVAAINAAGNGRFLFLYHNPEYTFIGRRRESAQAFKLLLHQEPVLLRGQGGVGKTALAEHLVRRLIAHNPAYHYFAFDETSLGLPAMISQLQDYLEKEHRCKVDAGMPGSAAEKLDLLLQAAAHRCKPVWIFDNMESCQQYPGGPLKEAFREWLQYVQLRLMNQFPVILTGRYPIKECPDIAELSLNQVYFADFYRKCLQLQLRTIHQLNHRITLDAAARILYTALGGSYRALELFDEIYKKRLEYIGTLLEKLQHSEGPHSEGPQSEGPRDGEQPLLREITTAIQQELKNDGRKLLFGELLHLLDKTALHTLQLLTQFRRPVRAMALSMQQEGIDFEHALRQLHDTTLIEQQSSGYYYVTPLVRDWLEMESFPPIDFNQDKAGEYYDQHSNGKEAGDMEEAFWHYSFVGNIDKLNRVGLWLANFFYHNSLITAVLQYASRVEEIAGGATHVSILNHLGMAYKTRGRFDEALNYFNRVHAISLEKKDRELEATALNNIGIVYTERGDPATALQYSERSRSVTGESDASAEGNDAPPGRKDASAEKKCVELSNRAQAYLKMGQLTKALKIMEECLATAQKAKYAFGEVAALSGLGQLYYLLVDREKAEQAFKSGLAKIEHTNHIALIASFQFHLGMLSRDNRENDLALKYLNDSLALVQEMGDLPREAETLNAIGSVYTNMKDTEEALSILDESLSIHQETENFPGQAATLHNLSQAYEVAGDLEKSLTCAKESLVIFRYLKDLPGTIQGLNNIGSLYLVMGDRKKALDCLKESLFLNEGTGNRVMTAYITSNMACIYDTQGDYASVIKYFLATAEQKQALKDYTGAGNTYAAMADIAFEQEKYKDYSDYLGRAFYFFDKGHNKEGFYRVGKEMGMLFATGFVSRDKLIRINLLKDNPLDKDKAYKAQMVRAGLNILKQCLHIGKNDGYEDVNEIEAIIEEVKATLQ
jgi:tetratricopeptide (TPR) repeat protein